MKFGNRLPSASLLVAVIALVMALAGGAYAAAKIQTSDIAKKAVTSKKIAGNTRTIVAHANIAPARPHLSFLSAANPIIKVAM